MLNAMLCLSLANTSWVVYRYYITVKLDFFCMDDWQTLKTLKRKTIVVWTALKTSGSLREAFRKQTKSNRCLECVQLLGRAQHTHMRGWDQPWSPHPTSPTSPTSSTSPLSQGELSFHRVMLAWLPPLLSASSAVPKSAPPPCVIGLQWSMAADEVLWHTDRNTRGSGTNKKKTERIPFSGPLRRRYLTARFTLLHSQSSACTQACCFLSAGASVVWPDIFFLLSRQQTIVSVLWVMWSSLLSLWC